MYSYVDYEHLYDSLGYNVPDEDLSNEEKTDLIGIINNLPVEKHEEIYLLILHDYVKSNPTTKVIFPYKSKQITTDKVDIKVDALPIKLKHILLKFSKLAHVSASQNISEESSQSTTQSTTQSVNVIETMS